MARLGSLMRLPIIEVRGRQRFQRPDEIIVEEPMEIRIAAWQQGDWQTHRLAVTMRTPGNDFELAAGFLFTEGAIKSRNDIHHIAYCTDENEPQHYNIVTVHLQPHVSFDEKRFSRHVYMTSSCGICGKAAIELVQAACCLLPVGELRLMPDFFVGLLVTLQEGQRLFARTGGLHASALFDADGRLLLVREDIGRHNAMDKLVGALLLEGRLPASNTVVLVSGRASFELVQKAAMAGIPALVAIGAPSSLAIELAKEFGMTLVGFLRDGRFNIYAGAERIVI